MRKDVVLLLAPLPEGVLARFEAEFLHLRFVDGLDPVLLDQNLAETDIIFGLPPFKRLDDARQLSWVQLASAGVPRRLCPIAKNRGMLVTNLSGLYGPTIAEHALGMLTVLARNMHVAFRNQSARQWDRTVAKTMSDLHGKTLGIVGLGNIGLSIARLAQAYGMRVVGCRRRPQVTPYVDCVYPLDHLREMLAEADHLAVAAPLTPATEGMLGPAEFGALRPGAIYVNVSRGLIAQEAALCAALDSGQVSAAGLDVFAVEPLPADHRFWTDPRVLVTPHYSGETVNQGLLPIERFARNLRARLENRPLEGVVDLEWGY